MRWQKEDVGYLIEKYPTQITLEEIAYNLKRSRRAILHKAARLGLSRLRSPPNKPKNPDYRKIVDKRYYEKNKSKIFKRKKQRILRYKLELIKKLGGKCKICGYSKSAVAFDFHHSFGKKENMIAVLLKNSSRDKIFKEAEKCLLLCANCHRELHYKGV